MYSRNDRISSFEKGNIPEMIEYLLSRKGYELISRKSPTQDDPTCEMCFEKENSYTPIEVIIVRDLMKFYSDDIRSGFRRNSNKFLVYSNHNSQPKLYGNVTNNFFSYKGEVGVLFSDVLHKIMEFESGGEFWNLDLSRLSLSQIDLELVYFFSKNFTEMKYLHLDSNNIQDIDISSLDSCKNLMKLYLHDNRLDMINITPLLPCKIIYPNKFTFDDITIYLSEEAYKKQDKEEGIPKFIDELIVRERITWIKKPSEKDEKHRKRAINLTKLMNRTDSVHKDEFIALMGFKGPRQFINWYINLPKDSPFILNGDIIYFKSNSPPTPRKNGQMTQKKSFFCQLDNEQHPVTESAYECGKCSRMVCEHCYKSSSEAGITTCPYCQGVLTKVQ